MNTPINTQTAKNYAAAKTCLKIIAALQPQRVEGKEQELVHIWAEALPADLPADTAASLMSRAYRTASFPDISDVCAAWKEVKQQRLERNMEPPDPPHEIATNPNAYHEYLCTWRHLVATGIHPRDAAPAALSNAKQQLQITRTPSTR